MSDFFFSFSFLQRLRMCVCLSVYMCARMCAHVCVHGCMCLSECVCVLQVIQLKMSLIFGTWYTSRLLSDSVTQQFD